MTKQRAIQFAHCSNAALEANTVRPAIIPPLLGKGLVASSIARQWTAAIFALKRARYLVIIGYSFPSTDTFMTRLLSEGLHANDDLKHVIVVDTGDPSRWKQLLESIFHPVFCKRKVLFSGLSAAEAMQITANNSVAELVRRAKPVHLL